MVGAGVKLRYTCGFQNRARKGTSTGVTNYTKHSHEGRGYQLGVIFYALAGHRPVVQSFNQLK